MLLSILRWIIEIRPGMDELKVSVLWVVTCETWKCSKSRHPALSCILEMTPTYAFPRGNIKVFIGCMKVLIVAREGSVSKEQGCSLGWLDMPFLNEWDKIPKSLHRCHLSPHLQPIHVLLE